MEKQSRNQVALSATWFGFMAVVSALFVVWGIQNLGGPYSPFASAAITVNVVWCPLWLFKIFARIRIHWPEEQGGFARIRIHWPEEQGGDDVGSI